MSEYSIPVQFIDLKLSKRRIRDKIDAAIAQVLDHGQYIMGPEVKQFEEDLKDFTGARHALTCANGTDALTLTNDGMGRGRGRCVRAEFHLCCVRRDARSIGSNTVFRRCFR